MTPSEHTNPSKSNKRKKERKKKIKNFQRCAFPFTWKNQSYETCAPIQTPSLEESECQELNEFLQNQKNGNLSAGISDEIKVVGSDGMEKKCYTTVPGQFGWYVYDIWFLNCFFNRRNQI